MGLFDTVRSSYDLGPGLWNKDLQTKDLVCLMCEYWIDPAGRLFEIDYSGTQDYTADFTHYYANGNHGRVSPVEITKTIECYPAKWDCYYAPFPSIKITLCDGIIVSVDRKPKVTLISNDSTY
jgi:hypothetical protein